MSYTSQPTNNRSMNGIISFDDGSGGILENGQLIADNSDIGSSQVDTLSIENQLNLDGNIKANTLLITPLWVSYLYGLTGNIQNQFNNIVVTLLSNNNTWTGTNTFNNTVNFNSVVNGLTKSTVGLGNVDNTSDLNKPVSTATQTALNLKSNIASPTFTGNVTLPTTYNNNFQYFRNVGPVLPTVSSQVFGAISTNYQSGHAEVDFWNNYGATGTTSAFRFYNIDNTTTPTPILLLNILRNGNTFCYGNFNCAGGLTLPSGQIFTFLGDITANSITITPVALSRIANLTSDAQTQINGLQTQINAIPANFLSSNNTFTGTNQFNNVTTFTGNISANSVTVTPVALSRISGLTSDAQTQINNKLFSNFGTGTNLTLNNCNIGGSTYFNTNQIYTSGNVTDYYLGTAMTSGTQVYINSSNNYIMNHIATNFMMYQWAGVNKHYFFNDGSMTIMGVLSCNYISCNNDISAVNLAITGTATGITKTMVGLGNCDNTSDVNKPVSTATQTALNLKANNTNAQFSGYTYFANIGSTALTGFGGGNFGAIATNLTGGHAEMDFVNTGFSYTNPTAYSFNWYLATSTTTRTLLASMRNNGNFNILGNFSAVAGAFTGALTGTTATFTGALTGTSATFSGAINAASATITGALSIVNVNVTGLLTSASATITNLITANSYTNTSANWGVIPSGSVKTSTVVISASTTYTKSNMPSIITNTSATGIEITLPADLDIGTEFTIINLKLSTMRLTSSNASLCQFYKYVGTIDLANSLDLAQYSTTYVLAPYSGKNVWFIKSSFQYPSLSTGKFGAYGAIMGNGNPLSNSQVYYLSLSCQWFNPASVDDYFIIMPGYILETYSGVNYTGTKSNYSNQPLYLVGGTYGTEPKFYHSDNPNTMVSYKLFYFSTASNYGEECAIPGFS